MDEINLEEINLDIDLNVFQSITSKKVIPIKNKVVKYEFQELVKKFAPVYGKRIYSLPYEKWYTDFKLNKAHEITNENCKGNINYLIKVMRSLP